MKSKIRDTWKIAQRGKVRVSNISSQSPAKYLNSTRVVHKKWLSQNKKYVLFLRSVETSWHGVTMLDPTEATDKNGNLFIITAQR